MPTFFTPLLNTPHFSRRRDPSFPLGPRHRCLPIFNTPHPTLWSHSGSAAAADGVIPTQLSPGAPLSMLAPGDPAVHGGSAAGPADAATAAADAAAGRAAEGAFGSVGLLLIRVCVCVLFP